MECKGYSRKQFIKRFFGLGSLLLGGKLFLNCRGKNESSGAESKNKAPSISKDPCNDLTEIPSGEIKKRQSLGYVLKSANPNTTCGNCGLHIPPKPNDKCGGCILFKGPVYKEGHCVQWAAITT